MVQLLSKPVLLKNEDVTPSTPLSSSSVMGSGVVKDLLSGLVGRFR